MKFSRAISRWKCINREGTSGRSCSPSASLLRYLFHATWAVINRGHKEILYTGMFFVLCCVTCCVYMFIVVPRGSNGFKLEERAARDLLFHAERSTGCPARIDISRWEAERHDKELLRNLDNSLDRGFCLVNYFIVQALSLNLNIRFYWSKEAFLEFIGKKIKLLIITYLQDQH